MGVADSRTESKGKGCPPSGTAESRCSDYSVRAPRLYTAPGLLLRAPVLIILACGLRTADGRRFAPPSCLHTQGPVPSALSSQAGPVEETRKGSEVSAGLAEGCPRVGWCTCGCTLCKRPTAPYTPAEVGVRVYVTAPFSTLTLPLHTCPNLSPLTGVCNPSWDLPPQGSWRWKKTECLLPGEVRGFRKDLRSAASLGMALSS